MQHFTADGVHLSELARRVLDEDFHSYAPVDQRRGSDERGLDGVDAEVEVTGILPHPEERASRRRHG